MPPHSREVLGGITVRAGKPDLQPELVGCRKLQKVANSKVITPSVSVFVCPGP
jgi:hypothetical protein